ncbi:hypothetical protein [Streptomyces scabiei]|uniref:hypothetical protein n=1 Tax=Streptomyces scabiei TaxID=1930 RepID=UPI0029A068E1|nr:hypothetical protein [Streptomyces scabiei]MDX3115061.1 hypothetical protein [Streptomyces scabiei]MDX3115062.1 hypothetical protein [Streptomyces scabiei]
MAFGAEELRVLRRALAIALHPGPVSAEDVQDCHRLAESLDEAIGEAARLRAFLVVDLGRYRAALPGTAAGYLTLLEEVLATGYRPEPDDLAALRALRGNPSAAALLDRCQVLAEQDVRARLARRATRRDTSVVPTVPASRTRLQALPGGLSGARRRGPRGGPGGAYGTRGRWGRRKCPGGSRGGPDGRVRPARREPGSDPGERRRTGFRAVRAGRRGRPVRAGSRWPAPPPGA